MSIKRIESVDDIFPGMGYDKYFELSKEELQELDNRVADTISKLQPIYPNAKELAGHVKVLGMFSGKLIKKGKKWVLKEYLFGELPHSEKGVYICGLGGAGDRWLCMLNKGDHFIVLGFNERTGDLITVSLDSFTYDMNTGEKETDYPTMQDVMKLVNSDG